MLKLGRAARARAGPRRKPSLCHGHVLGEGPALRQEAGVCFDDRGGACARWRKLGRLAHGGCADRTARTNVGSPELCIVIQLRLPLLLRPDRPPARHRRFLPESPPVEARATGLLARVADVAPGPPLPQVYAPDMHRCLVALRVGGHTHQQLTWPNRDLRSRRTVGGN